MCLPLVKPVQEICQRIKSLNKQCERLRILLHTDAAQALGKIRVDATELGVDYLTIVGHKVWFLKYFGKALERKIETCFIDRLCYIHSSMPLGLVLCM